MEIDKAIRECDDRRLKTKYANAIYVIQRALALYSIEEVAFSFNGGKDSTVLLHLLRAGHYLCEANQNSPNGNLKGFPFRTIYFESSSAFPEINSFTHGIATTYSLQMEVIHTDFKSGLEALIKSKSIRAIFLGVRIGDPTAVGQEQFSPSSPGWPPFMRVNPMLDWSYRDVWAFLLICKVPYCCLYDQGYTSIGSIHDTVPNALLRSGDSVSGVEKFRPAYMLSDGRLERAGRVKKHSSSAHWVSPSSDGMYKLDFNHGSVLTTSIIAVGDEILSGIVEDHLGPLLCRKLHSIGWLVSKSVAVRNNVRASSPPGLVVAYLVLCAKSSSRGFTDITILHVYRQKVDSVAEEVERMKSANDIVLICGGVGPLHSDVTLAGIAKSFGVRLAPDEEFEEYLWQLIGGQSKGHRNEMALLPEGITELLHHDKLPVPLIKCQNVIILTATNITELDQEWDCLIDLMRSTGQLVVVEPFVSKRLTANLSDVEAAEPLSKLCLEFPDVCIGCYRKSRLGPLVISFKSKDKARIDSAIGVLHKKFHPEAFSEIN